MPSGDMIYRTLVNGDTDASTWNDKWPWESPEASRPGGGHCTVNNNGLWCQTRRKPPLHIHHQSVPAAALTKLNSHTDVFKYTPGLFILRPKLLLSPFGHPCNIQISAWSCRCCFCLFLKTQMIKHLNQNLLKNNQ